MFQGAGEALETLLNKIMFLGLRKKSGHDLFIVCVYKLNTNFVMKTYEKKYRRNQSTQNSHNVSKKSRLYQRCRKSSKSFSKEHTWLISMCDENGNAVCSFCQARF